MKEEEPEREAMRRAMVRARLTYALFPILALILILSVPFPFSYFGLFNYVQVMPVLLFIFGVGVMFIGAFWDFGAKMYVKEVMDNNLPFGEGDLNYIYKQQFILTSIYIGVAFLYILAAVIIYLV
ncbi:MAG: hypothetical protein KIY12_05755 [Thermoplasmata archaeon]|uniref:Uncharacterized protein n=1 Tax=Candidatus Sysuiplasma superficiale TaxID=2823368 RepID=A0A8J7YXJ7_9ARCH|nr:hypothetical protein [Candidatus Sysuiplasma superficiale]MBX8644211.1 hypothetical protein [Candidatus Sysuiplasma superficiale]